MNRMMKLKKNQKNEKSFKYILILKKKLKNKFKWNSYWKHKFWNGLKLILSILYANDVVDRLLLTL